MSSAACLIRPRAGASGSWWHQPRAMLVHVSQKEVSGPGFSIPLVRLDSLACSAHPRAHSHRNPDPVHYYDKATRLVAPRKTTSEELSTLDNASRDINRDR